MLPRQTQRTFSIIRRYAPVVAEHRVNYLPILLFAIVLPHVDEQRIRLSISSDQRSLAKLRGLA